MKRSDLERQTVALRKSANAERKRRAFWSLYMKIIELEIQYGNGESRTLPSHSKEIAELVLRLIKRLGKNYGTAIL